MRAERLGLALELLRPSQWVRFEGFATSFIAAHSPRLRSVARAAGDRGRDAELFQASGEPAVVLQYSVTSDWKTKIRETAGTINKNFPDAAVLIYVTNQLIGAEADELRLEIAGANRLTIDVRDRTWFVSRLNYSPATQAASEQLALDIADPYLREKDVTAREGDPLPSTDARAALVYLELQWADDARDKGLTSLCFDALVRSVLRGTDPEHLMGRTEVHEGVRALLPSHDAERVSALTNSALTRLERRYIRHHRGVDGFCLTHDQRVLLSEQLATLEEREKSFLAELEATVRDSCGREGVGEVKAEELTARTRRVLETTLLRQGETFAEAVRTGSPNLVKSNDITDIAINDMAEHPEPRVEAADLRVVAASVVRLLEAPPVTLQTYLRHLADAYTLLVFLRETPDVQATVTQFFWNAEVSLDTSMVLPLLAEELFPDEPRRFTGLLNAARDAGSHLNVTGGVLEEVERHMHRSLQFAERFAHAGDVPFLLGSYVLAGRDLAGFGDWLSTFRGAARPVDDLEHYFYRKHGIRRRDLVSALPAVPGALRREAETAWSEIHLRRRDLNQDVIDRLIAHDVENFVGVLGERTRETAGPVGWRNWWLTLDTSAYGVASGLRYRDGARRIPSPVMSPDFLQTYLALGPRRAVLSREQHEALPLKLADASRLDQMPAAVLAMASEIRKRMAGQDEFRIQREVRDRLDAEGSRVGELVQGGLEEVERAVRRRAERADARGRYQSGD